MNSGLDELGIDDDDVALSFEDEGGAAEPDRRPLVATPSPDPDIERRTLSLEQALEQVPLFAGLLPIHLHRVAKVAREMDLARGDYVFHHGDPGDALYVIIEGAVRISRNVAGVGEEALAVLRPGMHFGEMSLIDDDVPRSADAIVHERARLAVLPKNDLRDLMFVDRELAYELLWRFVRTLSTRLRDSNDRFMMLSVSAKF